ncbi:MAG: 3-deoxy-D-manno-octulosonic acid transferase [Burkholderiales bacterium]|nr:3-deoxy-D-manno-octulosonic acid transferase [Burkholderiales bacterium]
MPFWFCIGYSLLWLLALPFALARLWWKSSGAAGNRAYRQHWRERLSLTLPAGPVDVWIHAVSVGEVRAVQPVLRALRAQRRRILVTCTTPTGRDTLQALLSAQGASEVAICYLPFDAPWLLRRFFVTFRPRLGLLVETELWPGVCDAAFRAGTKLWLINARLSQRSADGYARGGALTRQMLRLLTGVAVQSPAHRDRFLAIGARNVTVTGNIKFDLDIADDISRQAKALAQQLTAGRPYWVAGSTREGEEALLLQALAAHPLRQRAVAVIVPRHPERWQSAFELAQQLGYRVASRSGASIAGDTEVIVGDSMGEMLAYYANAIAVVMGGTLAGTGGQNLIEPCAVGVPVVLGPSVFNFQQAADEALATGAARAVGTATDAMDAVLAWFDDPSARAAASAAAAQFVAAHRGATARTIALLKPI